MTNKERRRRMTNEEKAGIISGRILGNKGGKTVEMFNACIDMAQWKDEQALNAYCDVCGHYHHTVPNHICRLDCDYYSNFKNKLKGGNK